MGRLPKKTTGSVRLIAAADLHLGRKIPLPDALNCDAVSPEGAWQRLVDLVIGEEGEVDALLLAGDLIDKEENVLEAPYYFEKGLQRLAAKNKPVIAIAGNHDHCSLRRRQKILSYPHFYLLGLQGVWETIQLQFGERTVHFEGWSFPASEFPKNPLSLLPPCKKGTITIGLLHGECDGAKESPYAPFTTRELSTAGRLCWVLGHIHIPRILCQEPPVFYCGSLQGLDSSEKGERGAYVIDIDPSGHVETTFIPLAGAVWHEIVLNITGVDVEEYEMLVRQELEKSISFWNGLNAIALKVIFQGEAEDMRSSITRIGQIQESYFSLNKQGSLIDCYVHLCIIEIRPKVDLTLLAKEKTIVGLLAKNLLVLQEGQASERKSIVVKVKELLEQSTQRYPHFKPLEDDGMLEQQLLSKGYQMLAELLEQKEKSQ